MRDIEVARYEASGSFGYCGVKILVDTTRELSKDERWNCRRKAEEILKAVAEETLRLDPERNANRRVERENILKCFGGEPIFVEEIPNGYCPDYCCKDKPWFIVTTRVGRINIGWRKRVISIGWNDSVVKATAEELFPDEQTTKNGQIIHAWSYEKAAEFLGKLMRTNHENRR